jgi:hypothetical protein
MKFNDDLISEAMMHKSDNEFIDHKRTFQLALVRCNLAPVELDLAQPFEPEQASWLHLQTSRFSCVASSRRPTRCNFSGLACVIRLACM